MFSIFDSGEICHARVQSSHLYSGESKGQAWMGSSLPSKIEQFFFTSTHQCSPAQKNRPIWLCSAPVNAGTRACCDCATHLDALPIPSRTTTLAAAGAGRDAVHGEHAATPPTESRTAHRHAAPPPTEHTARAPPTPPEPARADRLRQPGSSPAGRGALR
jgi:hypothetical protein